MSNTWFTSDLHLGHAKVAELRGYASVREHDEDIARRWAEFVGERDTVWVLGDVTVSKSRLMYALERVYLLPGTKHLVAGNHDLVHPQHRGAWKHQSHYLFAFQSVQPYARIRVQGEEVLLSHYPYADEPGADRGEVRYSQYRLPNEGRWLIHGHTHMEDQRVHGRQIHVGLDAWGMQPVSLAVIDEVIGGGAL